MNFVIKKKKTRTVNVYSPYEELKTTGLKFESNNSNFGEYTLTLFEDLKKINKTFKETTDLSKKQILLLLFDRSNTFVYYDYNGYFKPF